MPPSSAYTTKGSEFKFCLVLIGVGFLTCRFMQASAVVAQVDTDRFHQAVAIAQGQSDFSLGLPFEKLTPTDGFQRATWISQPGYEIGQIPVRVSVDGEGEVSVVYTVSYHSWNIDTIGHLRRVAIRVEWERASGARGVYEVEGIRAG